MFKRAEYQTIIRRLREPRRFIQVVIGPRQIGKSTVVRQVLNDLDMPYRYVSADNVAAVGPSWLSDCWAALRLKMRSQGWHEALLVIDEIQKVPAWSEAVKQEWDNDTFQGTGVKVLLLGSSRVLLERGLSESLAGRFEEIRMSHWSFGEMRECFGMTCDEYVYFGGFPGAATLRGDGDRWREYVQASIVDAAVNKDILMGAAVTKPALLRQTFELGATYSARILSLNKMLGALTDAGNTTTLASYLHLLSTAGLLSGLQKYSIDPARRRASIPKFQVHNNALCSIYSPLSFAQATGDHKSWGHLFESAIGAYIVCQCFTKRCEVYYWRDGNDEVDFVISRGGRTAAIEVKSNTEATTRGLQRFREMFHPTCALVVGAAGMPPEEFLCTDITQLL